MAKNYTPLDVKKIQSKKAEEPKKEVKHGSKFDAILVSIILITLIVLGVLLFMLYQKSL